MSRIFIVISRLKCYTNFYYEVLTIIWFFDFQNQTLINMKYSMLFGKTRREAPKEEESVNASLLIRAGFVEKLMAGVYTFLPLGFRVLKKIENIIREEMNAAGGQELLMPTLQPRENWEKTDRWNNYDTLYKFTSHFSKIDYVLGATHEEVITPLADKFIFSYKDLPLFLYHIQNKFRDEKRPKSGLLRGREFFMKDLYSFHTDEEDFNKYYEKMKDVYKKVFKRAGLDDLTYLTFASGGTFSKYSHEFQTLSQTGEDTVYLCEKCSIGVNKEIIEDQKVCPTCKSSQLLEKKAIEVGNIFPLKTRFSDAFNLTYKDKDGEEKPVIMGCYGIGLNRLMGTIVEVSHDENGIIWPESVAPYHVHLVHLGGVMASTSFQPDTFEVSSIAEGIYQKLENAGVDVLWDDRENVSAGEKFKDTDLIGIPVRLVVSAKSGNKIEFKKRTEKEVELLTFEEVLKRVQKI